MRSITVGGWAGAVARVFVSHAGDDAEHAGDDAELAGEVHRWLLDDGHEVFLDQDLRDGIAIGEEWEQRLHERLRWADAVVCVVTSAYLASVWCTAEVGIARARGSRLLPVLAERGVVHPLLTSVQHVDTTTDTGARVQLSEALRRVDAAGGSGWPDGRSPFPGLRPFDTDQHRVFFGRTGEVEQLVALLRSPAERAAGAVVLVVGPSGCGKSSLVRAGLLPVMADEPGWWVLPAIVPGADPVAALTRELAAAAQQLGLGWTVADVRRQLDDVGLAELAAELLMAVAGRQRRRLLVVVDQFEELLTQATPAGRARFAELLGPALGGPVQVVATLRPEFFDQVLVSSELAALPTRTHTLRPLRREALNAVIEGPARLAGIGVDADLVARLVTDTDSGEALPLLAYTLAELADGIERGGRLLTSRYEQLGGVQGALTRQADAALADAMAVGGRSRGEVIEGLLWLVTVDEQGRPTRWRVNRDELSDRAVAELDAFVARRLVTTDTENGSVVVGVAHEAFLSAWDPLAEAVTAASSALRARRGIEQAAAGWIEGGCRPSRLWERGQLAAALAETGARVQAGSPSRSAPADVRPLPKQRLLRWWPHRHRVMVTDRVQLSPMARDFLLASIRRDRYRRGRSTTILSVLLILALAAAGVAMNRQRAAEEQQRLATARQLVTQADAVRDSDGRTALLLGIAAQDIHPDSETLSSLVNTLTTARFPNTLAAHTRPVFSAAFAPDGRTLATGSADKTVRLWDLIDPTQPRPIGGPLTGHTDVVSSVAFAPDGRTLATASRDKTVLLWDLTDPIQPRRMGRPLNGYTDLVFSVAFAPDGRTLATATASRDDDSTVLLWDLTDPAQPRRLGQALTGAVFAVAFAPDGRTLATAMIDDNTVLLWDLTDPAQPRRLGPPLTGYTDVGMFSVAFAPDGRTLATAIADDDNTVLLWDLTDPAQPRRLGQPLTGHTEVVNSVTFARDGRTLATASADKSVLLWNLTDPTQPRRLGQPLTGHTDVVSSVAFTPDGRTLATASADTTVRLWDLTDPAQPRRLGQALTDHTGAVSSVAFAPPDGRTLATASTDKSVLLWDLTDPSQPRTIGRPLTDHTDVVVAVAFAPDGRILATVSADKSVLLWDLTDPSQPRTIGRPLTDHTDVVVAVAFAPDGRTLATASADHTVLLWDLTNPTQPRRLGQPLTDQSLVGDPADVVLAVAFAPDGRTLATARTDNTVRLWDLTDPTQPRPTGQPLTGHTGPVSWVAFAPDGRTLATASFDKTVLLWDLTDLAQPRRLGRPLTDHTGGVSRLVFAPDGRTLATASDDKTVLLWDLTDQTRPRRLGRPLTGHTDKALAVAFAPDGRTLATASFDKTVLLWDLNGLNYVRGHATERACSITGRGLNRDEWDRYIPGLEYEDTCAT